MSLILLEFQLIVMTGCKTKCVFTLKIWPGVCSLNFCLISCMLEAGEGETERRTNDQRAISKGEKTDRWGRKQERGRGSTVWERQGVMLREKKDKLHYVAGVGWVTLALSAWGHGFLTHRLIVLLVHLKLEGEKEMGREIKRLNESACNTERWDCARHVHFQVAFLLLSLLLKGSDRREVNGYCERKLWKRERNGVKESLTAWQKYRRGLADISLHWTPACPLETSLSGWEAFLSTTNLIPFIYFNYSAFSCWLEVFLLTLMFLRSYNLSTGLSLWEQLILNDISG